MQVPYIQVPYSGNCMSVWPFLFNPASWMDNGQDLCEALDKCTIPVLEIHLGNFNKKDTVTNVIAPHVTGILSGFGEQVYPLGLEVLNTYLKNR